MASYGVSFDSGFSYLKPSLPLIIGAIVIRALPPRDFLISIDLLIYCLPTAKSELSPLSLLSCKNLVTNLASSSSQLDSVLKVEAASNYSVISFSDESEDKELIY